VPVHIVGIDITSLDDCLTLESAIKAEGDILIGFVVSAAADDLTVVTVADMLDPAGKRASSSSGPSSSIISTMPFLAADESSDDDDDGWDDVGAERMPMVRSLCQSCRIDVH
jgi:hypothetical protein